MSITLPEIQVGDSNVSFTGKFHSVSQGFKGLQNVIESKLEEQNNANWKV